jgi:hypothetical protein
MQARSSACVLEQCRHAQSMRDRPFQEQ